MRPRETYVMMFGLSPEQWSHEKTMLKGGLQGMHMGWSLSSCCASTVEEAIERLAVWKGKIDVIQIWNGDNRPQEKLMQDVAVLAQHVATHPAKPWFTFYREVEYVEPVLRQAGVRVELGMPEYVIHERWVSLDEEEAETTY